MRERREAAGTTTVAQSPISPGRTDYALFQAKPRPYDIRAVDQFYMYCRMVARTDRHRDEAHARLRATLKRSIWSMLVAGSYLFYYLMDRAAQAMALF